MKNNKYLSGTYREADFTGILKNRIEKQKAFFNSKGKGELLLYVNRDGRGNTHACEYFYNLLANKDISGLLKKETVEDIVLNFIIQIERSLYCFYLIDDDLVPEADIFFHEGMMTGSMIDKKVYFEGQTGWCKEYVGWENIDKLYFNSDNPWVQFSLLFYQSLWKLWDESFMISGIWYHSPLDAAMAIAGSSIFEKMYTEPEKVKKLINWCCDWIIKAEKHFRENIEQVDGYKAVFGTHIPDGAIWVNGDAIDLISNDMAERFDLPYSGKLFTELGGGFYHHHSIGVHQIPEVAKIEGISVHEISNDYPSTKHISDEIINNESIQEDLIKASLKVPVQIDYIPYEHIEKMIPFFKEGRFILGVTCNYPEEINDCIAKINKINKLK